MNFLDLIDRTEGGGRYDTLFGHSQRGGPFNGVDVSKMTLGQLRNFSDPKGQYGQWVASQNNGTVATPMGRFQIVGRTMRDAAGQMGLSDDTVFDESTQNGMAMHLAKNRLKGANTIEEKRSALREEWEGLKKVPDAQLDQAIAGLESGEGVLSLSTRGSLGAPNPDPIEVTRLDNGAIPADVLAHQNKQAMLAAGQVPLNQIGQPVPSSNPAFAGLSPQQARQAAGTEQPEGKRFNLVPEDSFFGNKGKFVEMLGWDDMTQRQRDDRWLAIGAGLLSGDNWSEGLGNVAQNVLGLRQSEDEQAYREQRLAQAGQRRDRFTPVGSVIDGDGNMIDGVSYNYATGNYFKRDAEGNEIVIPDARPVNRSDATGTKQVSASQVSKLRTQVQENESTLRAIDRLLPALDNIDYGTAGVVNDLSTFVKTMSGRMDLSEDELLRQVAKGELQGMIGKVREDVVGPGVMTEMDALRVIAALGGDLNSIRANPQVIKERLSIQRSGAARKYQQNFDQYQAFTETLNSPYQPLDRYDPQPQGGQGGGLSDDIDAILQGYGV